MTHACSLAACYVVSTPMAAAQNEGSTIYDVTVESRTLVVDGVEVPIVHARPDGMPRAGVVLHPDIDGAAARCSTTWPAASPRTGSRCAWSSRSRASTGSMGDRRGRAWRRRQQLDDAAQLGDLEAAADLLVVDDDVARVSVLGFCMGGYYTFKAAASDRFDAAVAFYGMLRTPEELARAGHGDPLDLAADVCPTLAIFGSDDPWTPPADIDALRAAWAGRDDCEIIVIEGADHGFVHDPDRPVHRADDAAALWDRALAWMSPLNRVAPLAARAIGQLFAVEDAVLAAARDLEPAEPDERRDRLVHAFARRADHAGELLLGQRHAELVLAARELEQPLRGAAGDVEEHRVGERLVGGAEPAGEDRDDGPQQFGLLDRAPRARRRSSARPPARRSAPGRGRAGPAVEQRHLAEEGAGPEHGDDRFPVVARRGGDGDPARDDDEQPGGVVALGEDAVAPAVLHERRATAELFEQLRGQCAEEVGLVEHLSRTDRVARAVASDATGSRPAPASDRRDDPGARSGRRFKGLPRPPMGGACS